MNLSIYKKVDLESLYNEYFAETEYAYTDRKYSSITIDTGNYDEYFEVIEYIEEINEKI